MAVEDISPVIRFVAAHLDENHSFGALAGEAGLSPFHFHRIFSENTGESARQFSERLRLEQAAVLLLQTERPILDIALDCGFQGHEVFCRAFRRRFQLSPSKYRARGYVQRTPPAEATAFAERNRVARPCIGLFHRSEPETKRKTMSYAIEIREMTPQPVLVTRRRVKPGEIAKSLAEMFHQVFLFGGKAGVAVGGPPLTRYMEWGPGLLTLDAGAPIPAPYEGTDPERLVRGEVLPGGMVATTIHVGAYDKLSEAHAAMEVWIHEQGLRPRGPLWESYVTDPGEYPDPKDWRTEIFWPVESAKS